MAREKYDPNDFLDQLAAMAEASLIDSLISELDPKGKKTFEAALHTCEKYGIKGLDAIRFISELANVISCIDSLDGDCNADS